MSMNIPPTSDASLKAFEIGLQHLVNLGRVPAGLPIHPNPQPIYILNLAKGNQALLPQAKRVGLLYFAGDLAGHVAAGEVTEEPSPVVRNMRYGESARRLLKAYLQADRSPERRAVSYQSRLLRIPNALAQGFWLKPPAIDEQGLILPFGEPLGRFRTTGRPYPINEFLDALHRAEEGREAEPRRAQ